MQRDLLSLVTLQGNHNLTVIIEVWAEDRDEELQKAENPFRALTRSTAPLLNYRQLAAVTHTHCSLRR